MKWTFKELFDDYFKQRFKEKFGKTLFRLIRIIILLIIISFFYNLAVVPSESMKPTMEVKDYLLVKTIGSDYERGDIIAFKFPEDETQTYLKRLIGLPGESVEIKNGTVYIDDEPLEENYIMEKPYYDYPKTKIPKGNYFMLGDNRNNSYDSHNWGFVNADQIRGKVIIRLMPFNRIKVIN